MGANAAKARIEPWLCTLSTNGCRCRSLWTWWTIRPYNSGMAYSE